MPDKITRDDHFAERAKIGEIIAEIRLDKAITQDELVKTIRNFQIQLDSY